MATNRIKGLTVEIGGDTKKLEDSLKDVNSQVKQTQSALKDVNKLLKLDPGNTELLAQKQQLLANRVTQTTEKLEELKKAEKQLVDAGIDTKSNEYMSLKREIADTEIALKNATKESKNFNASLSEVSASLTKVGNGAQTVADKTKVLSAAGAGVVAGIGAMAVKAMNTADDLNTLAKQTGLATDELQKMQYASEMVDVSTEDITGALSKMRKNMNSTSSDTQEAWQRLGVSVKDANGEFRDSTDVFYETLAALSRIPNETERDILAMQLFGRSADQLAGIIDDGGAALKAYGDEAERSGKILSQEAIDAANATKDLVDQLKADVSQTILITGAKALEALRPVIMSVVEAVSKLLDFIGSLSPETLQLITVIAAAVAAISPIAGIIAKITTAINGVITLLPTLMPLIGAVTAAAPWIALGAAIAALVILVVKNWETIKTTILNVWDAVVGKIKDGVNAIIEYVNSAIESINSLIQKLNDSKVGQALGLNVKTIGTVPGLASGGVVQNGGTALVGENGAELLTVNNGSARVQPISNSTTNNYYGVGGTKTVEIPLVVNGRILARAIYDDLESEGIRRGSQLGAAL